MTGDPTAATRGNKLLRQHLKKCSDALLKVRPLGGSELFVRVGEDYYADPEYCGAEIDRLRAKLVELMRESVQDKRELLEVTLRAERAEDDLCALIRDIEEYEHINNLAPNPGKPDCWQSVTRAKATLLAASSAPGSPVVSETQS